MHGFIVVFAITAYEFTAVPAAAAIGALVSEFMQLRHRQYLYGRFSLLVLGSNDDWKIRDHDGVMLHIRRQRAFALSGLVILDFAVPGHSPVHVVLTRWNVPGHVLRRLVVRLKHPV